MRTLTASPARHRGLTSGLVLVTLGCIFLAKSFGLSVPEKWWAAFVLLPALPFLLRARGELARGRGREAVRSLVPVLVLAAVTAALVLDLDWSHVWPVFLILAGASMLLPRRARF